MTGEELWEIVRQWWIQVPLWSPLLIEIISKVVTIITTHRRNKLADIKANDNQKEIAKLDKRVSVIEATCDEQQVYIDENTEDIDLIASTSRNEQVKAIKNKKRRVIRHLNKAIELGKEILETDGVVDMVDTVAEVAKPVVEQVKKVKKVKVVKK